MVAIGIVLSSERAIAGQLTCYTAQCPEATPPWRGRGADPPPRTRAESTLVFYPAIPGARRSRQEKRELV